VRDASAERVEIGDVLSQSGLRLAKTRLSEAC